MQIEQIKTENLFHHPDNPRTEYNVNELIESIKENGILQPLTVVRLSPHIARYNVVAGNRRLEAAKAAGLKECPCIISDMNEKEQASIMLIENMQRKDLNPYEQGKGVQMCLDLGMSEEDIAKKTGFSKETIHHRKRMNELDQNLLKGKCRDGQITIQELVSLEKIKDINTRNEVLKKAGTNNFNYALQNAIQQEETEEEMRNVREILVSFAEEESPDWADSSYYQVAYHVTPDFVIPEDKDETEYSFKLTWAGARHYALYRKRPDVVEDEEPEASEYELNRRKQDECRKKLAELAVTFYNMRKEFMLKTTEFDGNIIQWLVYLLLQEDFSDEEGAEKPEGFHYSSFYASQFKYKLYAELMGDTKPEEYTAEDVVIDMKGSSMLNNADAATVVYALLEVGPYHRIGTWQGTYDETTDADELNRLYDFMELCGYKLSDAEKQILDGTHEYYYREDK